MFKIFDDPLGTVIRFESDIIADASDKLRTLLSELIEKKRCKFRFDFSRVKDMDPSALNIFVVLPDILSAKFSDSELEIVSAHHDIANMFKMIGLSKRYRIL
jgi:anti-anti-sigma regulatory factor